MAAVPIGPLLEGAGAAAKAGKAAEVVKAVEAVKAIEAARALELTHATSGLGHGEAAVRATRALEMTEDAAMLARVTKGLAETASKLAEVPKARRALAWTHEASTYAGRVAQNADPTMVAEVLACACEGLDKIQKSEILNLAFEVTEQQAAAAILRLNETGSKLENYHILCVNSRTRKELLPLAIEIEKQHRKLTGQLATLSPLLTGRRGLAAVSATLAVLARLEQSADAWRWLQQAYALAAVTDAARGIEVGTKLEKAIGAFQLRSGTYPFIPAATELKRRTALVDEYLGNARRYLAEASSEPKPSPKPREIAAAPPSLSPELGEPPVPANAPKDVPRPAIALAPGELTYEALARTAEKEKRLVWAEANQVHILPDLSTPLSIIQTLLLQDHGPREKVMIVRKPWAKNLSDRVAFFFGNTLIVALLAVTVIIVACPLVLAGAWAALFFLRRNKLRLELHTQDWMEPLTGRTEIGGLAETLCQAVGFLGRVCPWASCFLLLAILIFPVGLLVAEQSRGLPGLWDLVKAGVATIPCVLTFTLTQDVWQGRKKDNFVVLLISWVIMASITAGLLWLLISRELLFSPNFVLVLFLLPLGFGSKHCASQISSLGRIRSPDSEDFNALILRSFARDYDAQPIVAGMRFEAALCHLLADHGYRPLAVGDPWEIFPGGSAGRVYLPMHGWERYVINYIKKAKLIIVIPGDSRAVIWEQAALRAFGQAEQVLLLCPYETEKDRNHFDAYRHNVRGKFELPEVSRSGVFRFREGWSPEFVEVNLAGYSSKEKFHAAFRRKLRLNAT